MRHLKIPTLPGSKTWVDKDEIMLQACFTLLEKAIKEEGVIKHVCYKTHKKFVDEATYLVLWWTIRKGKYERNEEIDEEEDNEHLLRLMKIRRGLWT